MVNGEGVSHTDEITNILHRTQQDEHNREHSREATDSKHESRCGARHKAGDVYELRRCNEETGEG